MRSLRPAPAALVVMAAFAVMAVLVVMAVIAVMAGPARAGNPPFGVWFTQDYDGALELYPCGEGELCGRLVWMADESPPPGTEGLPRDVKNPDPARRDHTLCGLEMMRGFRPETDDLWSGGTIYNPDDGHDYHAELRVQGPVALGMRGYILTPLLGQTEIWTRVPADFTLRCREK